MRGFLICVALGLTLGLGGTPSNVASAAIHQSTFAIDGHRLSVTCKGAELPAVVLEAPLATSSEIWKPVVRALRYMTDLYDDVGGAMQVNIFQQNLAGESMGGGFRPNMLATELDPFVRGSVVMKIDNDYALRTIAEGKPNLDFIIAPAPMPADQLALGRKPVTWAGGFSLVIPRTRKNAEGAFKLIQFLTSWESVKRLEQGTRERRESEGRIYLPSGQANKVYFERLVKEAISDNPHVPPAFKRACAAL